ncbi:hypothetical protein EYC80_010143 [Monilinia laxa]|uniref:Cytidyltransferase-like domain-containing protein n=1 Tax=Monilinia laxa TaxID=61186 RepID=A0A5N6JLZ3_MONLA|nr:hypothetical protein EYC80_010143 [Monilinia laxa]
MASTSDKTTVALADRSAEDRLQSTAFQNYIHQASNNIRPFLQSALTSPMNTGENPARIFPPISSSCHSVITPQGSDVSWPILDAKARNNILLYTGSFNPPHQGHLATILYFHERRVQLRITAMIVFADPASVVDSRKKKWADAILPQNLRHELFYRVPEVAELVASGWLQFLGGDMGTHIKVLRATTDLISEAGFDVKLVGLLGGDKLTVESEPHLHPGTLGEWSPVDEFLIINARRPVDFFDPENEEIPRDLPGCTKWLRDSDKFNAFCMPEVTDQPLLAPALFSDEYRSEKDFPEDAERESQQ